MPATSLIGRLPHSILQSPPLAKSPCPSLHLSRPCCSCQGQARKSLSPRWPSGLHVSLKHAWPVVFKHTMSALQADHTFSETVKYKSCLAHSVNLQIFLPISTSMVFTWVSFKCWCPWKVPPSDIFFSLPNCTICLVGDHWTGMLCIFNGGCSPLRYPWNWSNHLHCQQRYVCSLGVTDLIGCLYTI